MKSLRESILDSIEVQMLKEDKLAERSKSETDEFLKAVGTAKNYIKPRHFPDMRRHILFAPHTLEQLGFDANSIKIVVGGNYPTGDWVIRISICTIEDQSEIVKTQVSQTGDLSSKFNKSPWAKEVVIDFFEFKKPADIVRDILKPASKSLESFKKLLNNMEKMDDKYIEDKTLLLK